MFPRRALLALALALLLAAPVALLPGADAGQGRPDFAAIDTFIEQEMAASRIPGLALAIVEGGEVVHARGFGDAGGGRPVTAETPFPIGSLTKSMTALAVMQLVEAGLVELDAPVRRYLPDFTVADNVAAGQITVRHLLNQTSGFSRATGIALVLDDRSTSLAEAVAGLRAVELNRPVGESYQYSNANFAVLALLVETVSGQPYGAYLQERIFTPLGMRQSTTSLAAAQEAGLTAAHRYWFGLPVATGLAELPAQEPAFASASDMGRYLAMYLNQGTLDGERVLPETEIEQMLAPATNPAASTLLGTQFAFQYGMGWFAGPFGAAGDARWHLGELPSFNAWMVLLPGSERAVAVLINAGSQIPVAGANQVMSRVPLGVVGLLEGQPAVTGPSLTGFYAWFDLIVLAILGAQAWSLARLLRQQPVQGTGASGRGWLAAVRRLGPLGWEIGLALALLLGYPALIGMSWGGSFLSMPDVTLTLIVVATLWLVTGLVRLGRLAWPVRQTQSKPLDFGRARGNLDPG